MSNYDNNKAFDDILNNALETAVKNAASESDPQLPDDSPVEFSERHIKNMERIFKEAKKAEKKSAPRKNSRRLLICAAAAVALIGIMAISAGANRDRFASFFRNIGEQAAEFGIPYGLTGETYEDENLKLDYIPYGFTIQKREKGFVRFEKPEKEKTPQEYANLSIRVLPVGGQGTVDTEGASIERMTLNGNEAYYIESDKGKIVMIYTGDFIIMVTSENLSRDETIKTAENIKAKAAVY